MNWVFTVFSVWNVEIMNRNSSFHNFPLNQLKNWCKFSTLYKYIYFYTVFVVARFVILCWQRHKKYKTPNSNASTKKKQTEDILNQKLMYHKHYSLVVCCFFAAGFFCDYFLCHLQNNKATYTHTHTKKSWNILLF